MGPKDEPHPHTPSPLGSTPFYSKCQKVVIPKPHLGVFHLNVCLICSFPPRGLDVKFRSVRTDIAEEKKKNSGFEESKKHLTGKKLAKDDGVCRTVCQLPAAVLHLRLRRFRRIFRVLTLYRLIISRWKRHRGPANHH